MKKLIILIAAVVLSTLSASAMDTAKVDAALKKPINCTTAEADISALMSAKEAEEEQKVGGLLSITPVGLVTNAVTAKSEEEKESIKKYNKMLDDKIAKIKKTCKIK
jgi:hypothetical protein